MRSLARREQSQNKKTEWSEGGNTLASFHQGLRPCRGICAGVYRPEPRRNADYCLTIMNLKEKLDEHIGDDYSILLADGLDEAFIGIGWQFNTPLAVYDRDKCMEILESQGMTPEEAQEYFYFNTQGAYVGEQTPIFIERI